MTCSQLTCDLAGGQQISFEWGRVRCFDKEVATMFLNEIKDKTSTVYVHSALGTASCLYGTDVVAVICIPDCSPVIYSPSSAIIVQYVLTTTTIL